MALVTVQRSPTPSTSSSPCVSESGSGEDDRRSQPRSISESFLTVKGAALFLPRGNSPTPNSTPRISQRRNKHTGDLRQHLQTMFTLLRPEDTIRLAVRLENAFPQCTRYMVVVSTNGRQDTEESIVLGMDFSSSDSCCTLGLVLPLWSNTLIHLDGDGGFSVSTVNRVHVFKPVSVQAMWSALQSLHKACEVARCHNYYPGSLFLTWVSYYQSRVSSDQICINEWNAMQDVQSHRADSPVLFTDVPTERERTERLIKTRLREIMMQKDLENVTCKEIRTELEMQMVCNLREFKEFIDNEMIVILGQMDSPTEIFDHVYLGSEWNASNLDELQNSGVCYILNVTREIDNFFPGIFEYQNIRVYDEEATNLLEYWNDTYKFISKAKKAGAKCLVHCKMGVSRSASTVIAYAMKEYGWDLDTAFDYVKQRRAVAKPNPAFMKQLEEYQGILLASKQRHNKLWRSHSDGDLSDRPDLLCKPTSHSLGRSDPRNNNNISSPSLHHFLGVAVLQALGAEPRGPARDLQGHSNGLCDSPELLAEDPLLRPAPRPRAATAIPVERVDTPPKVAVALPAAVPHPPPSVHVLPPPSEPQLSQRTAAGLSLDLPERRVSEDLVSPLILGSSDSDTLEYSLSDSPSTGASPATPLRDSPNDHNNNPSDPVAPAAGALDGCGEADGLSNHSADSIDFFSAREKFLGLAQDGWTRTVSEQASQRTPFSPSPEDPSETKAEEEQHKETNETPPPAQGNADEASLDKIHHHDNGISVRHIVTEIESISHPPAALSPTSSSPPSLPVPCRSLQAALHPPQQEEDRETGEVTHAPMTPPPHPQSPSAEPCDWPAGSVRRATEQLEQRLKQELSPPHAAPRSPPHSPSGEPPAPLPPGADPPAHPQRLTQGENAPPPFSTVPKDTEGPAEHPRPSGSATPTVHSPNSSFSPHSSPQLQSLPSLGVEGVTAQELDTDHVAPPPPAPCGAACDAQRRLVHSSQELQRIQRTLRELQAFLHEGIAPEAEGAPLRPQQRPAASGGEAMDTEPERGEEAGGRERQGKSLREPAWWSRAIALEARIRQAGLTPPSLMKRSASLAKLDRLELSADDLSDWDLCPPHHPHPSRPPPSAPHGSPRRPDDVWKKQRVLARPPRAGSPGPPSDREEETGEKEEAPARRGPSTRRARKSSMEKNQWSVAALYNTM